MSEIPIHSVEYLASNEEVVDGDEEQQSVEGNALCSTIQECDSTKLPLDTTLVEQCIQGEGMVQVDIEIKTNPVTNVKMINIVDVLKPPDGEGPEDDLGSPMGSSLDYSEENDLNQPDELLSSPMSTSSAGAITPAQQPAPRWVVCAEFRQEQARLNIPNDPTDWEKVHVSHWINWAMKQFPNASIDMNDWSITGSELCSLSHDEFMTKVPVDPEELLWTHLQVLRESKLVAKQAPDGKDSFTTHKGNLQLIHAASPAGTIVMSEPRKTNKKPPVRLGAAKFTVMSESALGNRTGNNGQVQLWQFLLELLTDKDRREVIHWIGDEGEFKLENPEMVAQLWGQRKGKPNMNYEKLSRAIRYYYDGDMISKVQGKRFSYKFVCDLRQVIGYSASELNQLVIEAEEKSKEKQGSIKKDSSESM